MMVVDLHKLLGAVSQASEVLKQKQGICVKYLEMCGILDGDGFMFCRIYELRSLSIMWDCGYLKFRGHGVR